MNALGIYQEVPNTDLSWVLYGLAAILVLAMIVGSLTDPGKDHPMPGPRREVRKTSRKSIRSTGRKKTK